jgi:flagellar hook-length control protein FliK
MNAAPVIQTSVQPTVGPSAAAGTDNSANAGGAPSAFAGVLNAAGAKPGRRAGASKQHDDNASGGSLPPAGNQSPPPPLPQAAAAPVATPHPKGGSAADRARVERGRASGSAPSENPLALQAAAAGAAALIDGTKSLSGSPIGAAERNAAAAGPGGAIKNAAAFGAMSGKPQMDARIESGLGAEAAAPAVEATAVVAANSAAAANTAAALTTTAAANTAAAANAAATANTVAAANTAAAASTAAAAKTEAPPPLESNSGLTSNSPATPDPVAVPAAITANATPAAASAANAAPTAASGAAGKATEKPHLTALHPVSKAMGGGTAAPAPATYSGTVPAGGSKADSGSSQASASSSDLAAASGGANAQVPATDTGAQDAAVTSAAAAAAMAGTTQPANTGKARSENSYDSDASASALEAAAEAAPAAASAPQGRSGMRAAAALATQDAANAPMVVDAGKHTHAGFDLAALADNTGGAAAGLSQLNANASVGAPADAAPTAALRIHASVDGADFTQGLSDRVSWMVDNGVNGAKLQVNPPQLGPIELRISVQGDHAQVWMTTHSAVARDALESSSPKLREMLNAQGFGQVSVDISQRSFQDRSAYTPPYQRESAGDRGTAVTPAAATTGASMTAGSTPRTLLGALDAYA